MAPLMPYAHFDDRYDDHKKVKRAWRRYPAAIGLHAMAVTYCNRHQSDGELDADWVEEKLPKARERKLAVDVLLEVGLFERRGDDYYVHDFLQWNRSRAQRQALAEQGRRGGQAKAAARASEPDGDGSSPGHSHGSSQGYSEGHTEGSSNGSSTPLHSTPSQAEKTNTNAELHSAVIECFAYWQERCNHQQAALSADRKGKLQTRLRERARLGGGMHRAIRDVRQAIDGAAVGAFVNDQGKRFDDIELICRTGSKLEDFMGRASLPVGGQLVQFGRRESPSDLLRAMDAAAHVVDATVEEEEAS